MTVLPLSDEVSTAVILVTGRIGLVIIGVVMIIVDDVGPILIVGTGVVMVVCVVPHPNSEFNFALVALPA